MFKRLWNTRPYALDLGLLILRVTVGLLMMTHGWAKYESYAAHGAEFPDPLHITPQGSNLLVIFAELICSGFLVIGLFSRIVLIPLIFNMLIIIFVIHSKDPLDVKEHAILLLGPYVVLFLTGPERFSFDALLKK